MPPLYNDLLNLGIADADAQALGMAFENEPDWITGLEIMTSSFFTDSKPNQLLVTGKPWSEIHAAISGLNGSSITAAFQKAVADHVSPALQIPLWDAMSKVWSKLRMTQGKAAKAGRPRRKFPKTAEYIQALTDLGYTFRMNTLHDEIEVNGVKMSDAIQAEIRTRMRDKGYQLTGVMEDAYVAHSHVNRYHPIQEYLNSLAYDGGPHIADLASYVTDKHGVFHTWLRRWLIGAVAKAHTAEQNYMLVLDGKQGIGKSRFAQWLCSGVPDYFIESSIDPENKDCHVRLISKWIWEVAELGSTTRKADREALKFFLTQQTVTVRRAYARYDLYKPALASFIGTINNDAGILSDKTGNRRFLVATIERLDWSYTDLDVNQVWAEAQAAYLAGEPWRLAPAEASLATELNEEYEVEDPIEGMLLEHFSVDPGSSAWTPTTMILQTLESNGLRGNTRANSMALASVLRGLGLEKVKGNNVKGQRVWGYRGIRYTGTLPGP